MTNILKVKNRIIFLMAASLILFIGCSSEKTEDNKKKINTPSKISTSSENDFYQSMKKINAEQKAENEKISSQLMEGYDEVTEIKVVPYVPPLVKVASKENKK